MAPQNSPQNQQAPDAYGPSASHRARPGELESIDQDTPETGLGEACPHCKSQLLSRHYRIRGDQKYHGNGAIDIDSCPNGCFKRQIEVRKENVAGSKRGYKGL